MNLSELNWRRSSRCESGHCIRVAFKGDKVYVSDSKLGDGSPVLEYTREDWQHLLDEIRAGNEIDGLMKLFPDDYCWQRVDYGPCLHFTFDELKAFLDGVNDGEFRPESSHVG